MSEAHEQADLFYWAILKEREIPELKMLYAVPNGGYRPKKTGGNLKAQGVKAGVWDIALDIASGGYHGFKGEMKFGRNKLTPEQEQWGEWYQAQGYKTVVAYTWFEMAEEIVTYLGYPLSVVGEISK